jgi:hypothetical protein
MIAPGARRRHRGARRLDVSRRARHELLVGDPKLLYFTHGTAIRRVALP